MVLFVGKSVSALEVSHNKSMYLILPWYRSSSHVHRGGPLVTSKHIATNVSHDPKFLDSMMRKCHYYQRCSLLPSLTNPNNGDHA